MTDIVDRLSIEVACFGDTTLAAPALKEIEALQSDITRLRAERDQWIARESDTQGALQKIGEEFGVRGGEPRTSGVRRVLAEQRGEIARLQVEKDAQTEEIIRLRAERDEALKQLAGLREEIASGLDAEASMTPCEEDAKVVRACAALVRANFSYDTADAARALAEGKEG